MIYIEYISITPAMIKNINNKALEQLYLSERKDQGE